MLQKVFPTLVRHSVTENHLVVNGLSVDTTLRKGRQRWELSDRLIGQTTGWSLWTTWRSRRDWSELCSQLAITCHDLRPATKWKRTHTIISRIKGNNETDNSVKRYSRAADSPESQATQRPISGFCSLRSSQSSFEWCHPIGHWPTHRYSASHVQHLRQVVCRRLKTWPALRLSFSNPSHTFLLI